MLRNENCATPRSGCDLPDAAWEAVASASRLEVAAIACSHWLRSPRPYLMLIGFALFLGFWYLAVEVWRLPRFRKCPGHDRHQRSG